MQLTLLGTGDAAGMPLYGCECHRCELARLDINKCRGPASALLEFDSKRYLIDAGNMDIAEQFPAGSLDGIFLTHFHPDHVQGLFHLRWGIGKQIPVYCPPDKHGCADLFKHPGILDFQALNEHEPFKLDGLEVTPLPLIHSKPTFGYLFNDTNHRIAYLSDTRNLPARTEFTLRTTMLDLMVIDTTEPPEVENKNHNSLDLSLSIHERVGADRTVLTHIGHDLDVWLSENQNSLPEGVEAGVDDHTITL
jgi:phosphoribosyl 1,2-cyclic phosphate phosphodiesterase